MGERLGTFWQINNLDKSVTGTNNSQIQMLSEGEIIGSCDYDAPGLLEKVETARSMVEELIPANASSVTFVVYHPSCTYSETNNETYEWQLHQEFTDLGLKGYQLELVTKKYVQTYLLEISKSNKQVYCFVI